MDTDGKVASIHTVGGIIAGYLSYILSSGVIFKNEAIAVIAALVILYILGQLSERLFGKEEVNGLSGWLWSGIVPFFFIWIMVWVIFANLQ
ncbi:MULTISPECIES: DUF5379 family protein [Methanobacterium]|jgi:cell division protein ZapA (FtsZ GTPase activity inhibitor)|uniref:DUF5379 family protein n=1 Tax=Methanobacterium veterum TaxID=408577 RepID=A0A9E5A1B3_9EURY|nr:MULTISPECIES: DUF5379 family protein [Methanobacterium]MCZ3364939.1 DUF5379 family protein [Methanobacterium veterum]MCZ3372694.1 DUF5379 family protein [Methanobacterium veterum]